MASSVKTRKMISYKGKSGPSLQRSPTKITKYTLTVPSTTRETEKQKANTMPTPSRQHITADRSKSRRDKGHNDQQEEQQEEEIYSDADEISITSDDLPDTNNTNNTDVPFASLGELEQIYTTEIDPREIVLSADNIPLVLLSFMSKIERLESRQSELELENINLKGSLDFAYNKLDDLEKSEREQAENAARTQEQLEIINSDNTQIKVNAQKKQRSEY